MITFLFPLNSCSHVYNQHLHPERHYLPLVEHFSAALFCNCVFIQLIWSIMQCCGGYQNGNLMKQSSLPLTVKYPGTNYGWVESVFAFSDDTTSFNDTIQQRIPHTNTQAISAETSALEGNICTIRAQVNILLQGVFSDDTIEFSKQFIVPGYGILTHKSPFRVFSVLRLLM